ncbi:MAG: hypothetical protein LBR74_10175 [Eubacterium sp.]|jgi:hypothetical protein|nr:hypothetical protein [Eubacterium sp.]
MNYGVVVKGQDTDTFVKMPERTFQVPGGVFCYKINIASIDAYNEPQCTYRRCEVRKTNPVGKSGICFGIQLMNSTRQVAAGACGHNEVMAKYPQKHIIDVCLYGANGQNGFYPDIIDNSDTFEGGICSKINEIFEITQSYDGGSSLRRGWMIRENDWWAQSDDGSDASFYASGENYYTRASHMMAALCSGNFYTEKDLKVFKSANMFYSDGNECVIRATIEIFSDHERFVTFEKFKGTSRIRT